MSKAKQSTEARWTAEARKLLVGRKIADVFYMSNAETLESEWRDRPLCIKLDDGVVLIPMMDEEGNDGGVLATTDDTRPILPTLRAEGY